MKNKKHLLISALLVAMMSSATFGIVACKDEEEEPINYGEAGVYYYEATDGEYSISLSGDKYTLYVGDTSVSGTYSYDGNALKVYDENGTELTANLSGGVLTLEYDGGTYRFLKKVSYQVTYNANGGSEVAAVKVLNGKTLSKPADPTKDGYDFIGWYTDEAFTQPFVFGATPITGNVTLYARYAADVLGANEYEASLIVDGKTVEVKSTKGGVAYDLPTPTKDGATFAGWWMSDYQDASKLTCQYTGQALTEDANLYAVWKSDAPLVSVTETGIKWNAVSAAASYTAKVYDSKGTELGSQTSGDLEYQFNFGAREAGDYRVVVTVGTASTTVYYKNKALDRVSLFTVAEPSVLVFNAVENAEKYLITVDCGNDEHKHTTYDNGTSTNFNFINCEMQEGGITFIVEAVANGYASSVSETYYYERNLDAVTGVVLDSETGKLYWNPVAKATSYKVEVTTAAGTETLEVVGTSVALGKYTGDVEVKVYAQANGYNESKAEYAYTNAKLPMPTNVKLNYNTVEWTKVEGATGYKVQIGAYEYETETNSFELPEEFKEEGKTYTVAVQAVGDDAAKTSYLSEKLSVKYGKFSNVTYNNGGLNWVAVGGAYGYQVSVNGGKAKEYGAATSFTEVEFTKVGDNKVAITAVDFLGRALDTQTVTVKAEAVTFDARNSKDVTTMYKAVGDKMTVKAPTNTGYDFAGWYNVPGGADNNGAKLENMTYAGNGANIYYAYWSPKSYEVTLKIGEETVFTETVRYGQEYKLSMPISTDAAKTFGGWYAEDNSQGRKYTNPLGESLNNWDLTENRTLYAGWIDVLGYQQITTGTGGKAYQVVAGEGIGYVSEVTVPATYTAPGASEALPVIAIAANAFYDCDNLVKINIPDTIESIFIGAGGSVATGSAFYSCNSLEEINVYCVDGEHGEHADHETYFSSEDGVLFRHNTPQVPLENGKEIYFFPNGKTGSYTIPSDVEVIPNRTFYNAKLSELIIPASVKIVGDYAFYQGSMENIVFEEVEGEELAADNLTIGKYAFAYVSAKTITFPARLEETDFAGKNIFYQCSKIAELNVNEGGKFYTSNDGMLCDKDGVEILYCPAGRSGELRIPVAIESIAANAFKGNKKITKLVVGDNVKEIGVSAFESCTALTTIDFRGESGALKIDARAFYGCPMLRDLALPKNLKVLGTQAFGDNQLVRSITLNCSGEVEFANGVFADDEGYGNVAHLVIGENMGVFEINGVFSGCTLSKIEIQGNNPNYAADEDGVLYNSDMTKLIFYPYGQTKQYVFPTTVTAIGAGVFEGKTNITQITIPKQITEIGEGAFKNSALTSVTFESGRTANLTIGASAFEGCIALTELDIPETTVAIGDRAFANCSLLESISLPATLTTFGTNGAATIFEGCSDISEISVALGCEVLESRSGILYGKTEGVITDLIFVPAGLTGAIELPNTITNVPEKVFYGHRGITQITFEDGTASANLTIGEYAFANMSAIKKIILPSGLVTIPRYMASNSSLEEIFIPNTVSYLRQAAFYNCTKLATITFEEGNETNVLTLDEPDEWGNMDRYVRTFSNVPAETIELRRVVEIPNFYFVALQAKKIILPGTLTTICEGAFDKSALEEIVFAKKEDGTRAPLTLEEGAFQQSASLKSVTIPNNIVSSVEAFYNCNALETVVFEAGSTNVGSYMFQNCKELTSVTFVDSITTIGKYAFQNCDALETITLPANITEIPDYLFGGEISTSGGTKFDPVVKTTNKAAEGLKEITIPAGVTRIGANAFTNCTSLAKVTFATGCQITEIGDYAFENTALTSFSVPQLTAGTTKLGLSILKDCASLASVSFPSTVIDLNSALLGCSALTTFVHAVEGTSVDETNKIIYADNGKRLVLYYGDATELVIPSTVEEIGDGAFTGKTSLTKVTIPDSVKVIGDNAFQNCTALATVELNSTSGLVELGNYAFANTAITSISLPATMVDRGVEEENVIGEYAFRDCTALTTVAVNGTAMGRGMFYGCTSLKNVTLNKNITNFYGESFRGCTSLENITLPEKLVTVYAFEFYGCTSLKAIEFPKDLTLGYSGSSTSIKYEDQVKPAYHGSGMFYNCTSLASVKLNDSLTMLPGYIFYGCTSLTEFVIPSGMKVFGSYALQNCSGITELKFPDCFESLGYSTLNGMTSLTKLDFSNTVLGTPNPGGSYSGTTGSFCFQGCTKLEEVILPATITVLKDAQFSKCSSLKKIVAPGVTSLANWSSGEGFATLAYLTKLETVQLSDSLVSLGDSAFYGCSSLKEFNFPDTLTTIGKSAFVGTGLTEVKFGSGLVSIGASAFEGSDLKTVELPAALQTIGASAFGKCKDLTAFTIDPQNPYFTVGSYGELYDTIGTLLVFPSGATGANGVVELEDGVILNAGAFQGCLGIQAVQLPSTIREIPASLFKDSSVEIVQIPSGVRKIGAEAFSGCTKLTAVDIPSTVTTIDTKAFYGCTNLQSITLPANLQEIAASAFEGCSKLTTVVAPAALETIGASAFKGTAITEFEFGKRVRYIMGSAFANTKLVNVTIPDSIETLEASAFSGCTKLETLVIKGAPVTLGTNIFEKCASLTSVTLEGEWKLIPKAMFYNCTKLETVVLPNTITEIAATAFESCTVLDNVTLPSSLETIGAFAFSKTGLTSITIPASVTTLGSLDASAASGSTGRPGLIIKAAALPGKLPISGGVTESSNVFADCKSLTTVVFEGAPTTMHGSTFKGCTALESVTFGGTWTKLEKNMFEGCTKLTNLTIPATVTEIGADAFKGWTATQVILVPDKTEAEATAAWGEGWNGSATVTYKTEE